MLTGLFTCTSCSLLTDTQTCIHISCCVLCRNEPVLLEFKCLFMQVLADNDYYTEVCMPVPLDTEAQVNTQSPLMLCAFYLLRTPCFCVWLLSRRGPFLSRSSTTHVLSFAPFFRRVQYV